MIVAVVEIEPDPKVLLDNWDDQYHRASGRSFTTAAIEAGILPRPIVLCTCGQHDIYLGDRCSYEFTGRVDVR